MKVLVIDDNAVNRRYVKSVIENESIKVFEAHNGQSGITIADEIEPDLLLVDIQMPDMDGFKCLKALRKTKNNNLPILAITAFSSPEDREIFINEGFQDYITKPVKPQVLSSTVDYWLKISKDKSIETSSRPLEFDPSVKEELLKLVSPEGIEELYEEFREEIASFISELNSVNSSKNLYNICSILHTIKGNAGSLGFFELSELANQIETKIKLGNTATLTEEVLSLSAYTKQLFFKYETQFKINL